MLIRICSAVLFVSFGAHAGLVRIEVKERSAVLDGRAFGKAGAYERIKGTAYFAVDPKAPANGEIVDLDKAPRNDAGLVEFSADLYMLKPRDQSLGNRTVLYEAPNRGGKGMLGMFDRATSSLDPTTPEHFGDGMLLEAGYTLAWVGWQQDVPTAKMCCDCLLRWPKASPVGFVLKLPRTKRSPASRLAIRGTCPTR